MPCQRARIIATTPRATTLRRALRRIFPIFHRRLSAFGILDVSSGQPPFGREPFGEITPERASGGKEKFRTEAIDGRNPRTRLSAVHVFVTIAASTGTKIRHSLPTIALQSDAASPVAFRRLPKAETACLGRLSKSR